MTNLIEALGNEWLPCALKSGMTPFFCFQMLQATRSTFESLISFPIENRKQKTENRKQLKKGHPRLGK